MSTKRLMSIAFMVGAVVLGILIYEKWIKKSNTTTTL